MVPISFLLAHLLTVVLLTLAVFVGVVIGVICTPDVPRTAGRRTVQLGWVADIPVCYLTEDGDAAEVSRWLAEMKDGVAIRA